MQSDNTAQLTQRTLSNCNCCQDEVKFLCVVFKALNQPTSVIPRLILHVHVHSTQLHDMLSLFPTMFTCWAFFQECFFSASYLSHSFNLLLSFSFDKHENSHPDQSSDFSKSHSKWQNKALNQFKLVQILCSFPCIFCLTSFRYSLGKGLLFLKNKIVPQICTLCAALTVSCLFPFIEN